MQSYKYCYCYCCFIMRRNDAQAESWNLRTFACEVLPQIIPPPQRLLFVNYLTIYHLLGKRNGSHSDGRSMSLFRIITKQSLSWASRSYNVAASPVSYNCAARLHFSSYSNGSSRPLKTWGPSTRKQTITQSFSRTRRRFSSSPIDRHAHLDPPKPGEE